MNPYRFRSGALCIVLSVLLTLLLPPVFARAIEIKPLEAPGGVVTSIRDFEQALGGHVLFPRDNEVVISRDVVLMSPLVIRGGDYLLTGAGCRLYRGFEDGNLICAEDGAKLQIGRERSESDDVSLIISGNVKTITNNNNFEFQRENEKITAFDPAHVKGALIHVSGGSKVTQYGGTAIQNNHSIEGGGGIICENGIFQLIGGELQNCSSDQDGGIILLKSKGEFLLGACTVNGGLAKGNGGILASLSDSECSIVSGTLEQGQAKQGGAIYAEGKINYQNAIITSCSAEKGGGVYYAGDNTITGLSINDCNAETGGGIYLGNGVKLTLESCNITKNSAMQGGGIFLDGTVLFKDGVISQNKAEMGGGYYVTSQATLRTEGGTAGSNEAKLGGGIFNEGTIIGINCSIALNRAEIGEAVLNLGVLQIYQSFYCSESNSILLVLDPSGKGAITVMQSPLQSQPPYLIPGRRGDGGIYEPDYNASLPLLIGDEELVKQASSIVKIVSDGNDQYGLNESGMISRRINYLIPILIGAGVICALCAACIVTHHRRKVR